MQFKDFITKQRVVILVIGLLLFAICISAAHGLGFNTLPGELSVDLAASAVTVVFTALVIDYINVREEFNKTKPAAGLAEDEIRATCFRIKWRMGRLFGMTRSHSRQRNNISSRTEAREYFNRAEEEVNDYLEKHYILDEATPLVSANLSRFLERLEDARTELEQTLVLYQYALSYSLRERVLELRAELQIADNILSFVDFSDELNEAHISLIKVLSQSIYEAIQTVLEHDSHGDSNVPLHAKDSRIA
jgi:hypothetical protein